MAKRGSDTLTLSPSIPNPPKKRKAPHPLSSLNPALAHPPSHQAILDAPETAILSQDKVAAYEAVVVEGKNVFVTGQAGTGKSHLFNSIVRALHRKYAGEPGAVAITASTCTAANKIGGVPLFAWAGFHPDIKDTALMEKHVRADPHAMARWRSTKVLLVDEISQLEHDQFDKLDALAKALSHDPLAPLGGIQFVAVGDFFQLSPQNPPGGMMHYVFESKAWKVAIHSTFVLSEFHRQHDPDFIELLQNIRLSRIRPWTLGKLAALSRPLSPNEPVIQLCAKKEQVFWSNHDHLVRLDGSSTWFHARDSGRAPPEHLPRLLREMPSPGYLDLKVGAQVILVADLDLIRGLRTGTIGFVEAFEHAPKGPSHQASFLYYVVRHGVLFDIATDRAISPGGFVTHQGSTLHPYPVVRFNIGQNTLRVLIKEYTFRVQDQHDVTLAQREQASHPLFHPHPSLIFSHNRQLPLDLGWAMSVHQSQGQTLPRVIVNTHSDYGNAYTALSRAPNLQGLQVESFHIPDLKPHPLVLRWHKAQNPSAISSDEEEE